MHKHILAATEDYVSGILTFKTPPHNTYHNLAHTEDVVRSCIEICIGEHLAPDDLEMIQIAAWFHDIGYIEKTAGHEEISVLYATNFLSDDHYDTGRIEKIIDCIRATKVPQNPNNKFEQIICDADLNHLGRKSFFERNDLLRSEFEHYSNSKLTESEWLVRTIEFLNQHHFFTNYALKNFQLQKEKNIRALEEQLKKLSI